MKNCQILAQGGKFGDVRVSSDGQVFVNLFFNDLCLKFSPEGFLNFSNMVEKASSGYIGKTFFDAASQS